MVPMLGLLLKLVLVVVLIVNNLILPQAVVGKPQPIYLDTVASQPMIQVNGQALKAPSPLY